jgi:hypothetical protein
MGTGPDSAALDRPREWLAMPGGRIRPVVSVPGEDDIDELLAYDAWLARLRPVCRCGQPRLGSGRTCGSAECVAALRAAPGEPSRLAVFQVALCFQVDPAEGGEGFRVRGVPQLAVGGLE